MANTADPQIDEEELADFLGNLMNPEMEHPSQFFGQSNQDAIFAVVPLETSIGSFVLYTIGMNELYQKHPDGKCSYEELKQKLKEILNCEIDWLPEIGHFFAFHWNEFEELYLDRYLFEAYHPLAIPPIENRIEKTEALRATVDAKKMNHKELSDLLLASKKTRQVKVPMDTRLALLMLSSAYRKDEIVISMEYEKSTLVPSIGHCNSVKFGMFCKHTEFLNSVLETIVKHITDGNQEVVQEVSPSKTYETTIALLHLDSPTVVPSTLLMKPEDLLLDKDSGIYSKEDNTISCSFRGLLELVELYCRITKEEEAEPVILQCIEEAKKHEPPKLVFDNVFNLAHRIEEKDPLSCVYKEILK